MAWKHGSGGSLFRVEKKKSMKASAEERMRSWCNREKCNSPGGWRSRDNLGLEGRKENVQRGDSGWSFAYNEQCIGGEWVGSLASSDSLLHCVVRFHGTKCNHQQNPCGDEAEGEMLPESPQGALPTGLAVCQFHGWCAPLVIYLFIQRFLK